MPQARAVHAGSHGRCTHSTHAAQCSRRRHVCHSREDTKTGPEGRPLVRYQPRVRKVAPAPSEVPVVHSSSYLLQEQEVALQSNRKAPVARRDQDLDATSNAMEWALRRADAYFDKVEAESAENSTVRTLVQNPATRATMKTMQGVTTLGAATAPQIAKAALPIGKKLLSLSADVLVAGVSALNDAAKKNEQAKRPRDK
eukprot:jgi/Ulvmu1/8957/UM005_0048.1